MITADNRIKLKKLLKHNYVSDVLKELEKKNVLNTKNKPHSADKIRVVFNGHQSNPEIEDAILKVYANRKALQTKKEKVKNKLLSA